MRWEYSFIFLSDHLSDLSFCPFHLVPPLDYLEIFNALLDESIFPIFPPIIYQIFLFVVSIFSPWDYMKILIALLDESIFYIFHPIIYQIFLFIPSTFPLRLKRGRWWGRLKTNILLFNIRFINNILSISIISFSWTSVSSIIS